MRKKLSPLELCGEISGVFVSVTIFFVQRKTNNKYVDFFARRVVSRKDAKEQRRKENTKKNYSLKSGKKTNEAKEIKFAPLLETYTQRS